MTGADLERIMVENYTQVFKQILSSLFKGDPNLKTDYLSAPIERQREIDAELASKSARMAQFLVSKLKEHGYLQREATDSEIEALIRTTLEEFGTRS